MALKKSADYQYRVHSHLIVLGAQILLSLDRQLGQSDREAAAHIVIISVDEGPAKREVVLLVCSFSLMIKKVNCRIDWAYLRGLSFGWIIHHYGFGTIGTVWQDDCLGDDFGTLASR